MRKLSFEKSTRCYKTGIPFKILSVLVVFTLFCVSCSVNTENNKTKEESTTHDSSNFSSLSAMPIGFVPKYLRNSQNQKLIAKFPKEVIKVRYGTKGGVFIESKVSPIDCYWTDYTEKVLSEPVIIGTPKDGTEEIVFEYKSVFGDDCPYCGIPYIIDYNPHNPDEQIVSIKIEDYFFKPIKLLVDDNGSVKELEKVNAKEYKTEVTLSSSKAINIYFLDEKDKLVDIQELKLISEFGKRKYICPPFEVFQRRSICSTDLNGDDFRLEYFLELPKPNPIEDEKYPVEEFIMNLSESIKLLMPSKDARYFFLSAEWRRYFESTNTGIFANDRRVQNTILTDYLIFDSQDRSYHTIGTHYRYELFPMDSRGPSLIEKGDIVLPVKWYDDRVVCSLVTKIDKEVRDGEVDTSKLNFEAGVEDAFSPYATAKGIEVDLSTFEYKDSQEFKPLSPFMSFADDSTDIIGYDDIYEKSDAKNTSIQWTSRFNYDYALYTNVITDYLHTKEYRMSELFKQNFPSGFKITKQEYCGSRIVDGKKTLFFFFMGDNASIDNSDPRITPKNKIGFKERLFLFSLDFETGQTTRIIDMQKKSEENWPQSIPSFYFISLGTGNNPTNLWAYQFIHYPDENGRWPNEFGDLPPKIILNGNAEKSFVKGKPEIKGYIR